MLLAATLTVLAVATNGFSLLGYAVVCWQAYFIAANLPVRRKLWVTLLLLGAVGTLVLSAVRSYFSYTRFSGWIAPLACNSFSFCIPRSSSSPSFPSRCVGNWGCVAAADACA